jgi:hypothetical protein
LGWEQTFKLLVIDRNGGCLPSMICATRDQSAVAERSLREVCGWMRRGAAEGEPTQRATRRDRANRHASHSDFMKVFTTRPSPLW